MGGVAALVALALSLAAAQPSASPRHLQSLIVSTNASDPVAPAPLISWTREWMPVRVTVTAGLTAPDSNVRVLYSWRHPQFPVTCAGLQYEEVTVGPQASMPLFYESQTVRAVTCGRGYRQSNETVAHVVVTRYPGLFIASMSLVLMVLGGAVVVALFTTLCLPDGGSFDVPAFLVAVFPAFVVAFNSTTLFDFISLGAVEPVFIIIGALGSYVLLNAAFSVRFFTRDIPAQRKADYRFRRWLDKHQFEHTVMGLCSSCCGVGCLKLIYLRLLRLWPFSPDFKAPPGFVPADIGAGGMQGAIAAAAGNKSEATTVGGGEVDASGHDTESHHLDSRIPPHAQWRLDMFQLTPLIFLHAPCLALGLVLEFRWGQFDWPNPLATIGLIAFNAAGLLVMLYILFQVCTVSSKERYHKRRRYRAIMMGRATSAGGSFKDSDDDSARESEHGRLSRQLSLGGSDRDSRRRRGIPTDVDLSKLDPEQLAEYRRKAPGQPRLLFAQADADARKELSKKGVVTGAGGFGGEESPRMGNGGRNAIVAERRQRMKDKERRRDERRERRDRAAEEAAKRVDPTLSKDPMQRQIELKMREAKRQQELKERRWDRAVGLGGYGDPEPEKPESAELFNMILQRQIDDQAKSDRARRQNGGFFGGMLRAFGTQPHAAGKTSDDALEVTIEPGEEVTMPGGGKIRTPGKRKVVAKPSVVVGSGAARKTIQVAPDSPRALEAAARQQMDFDEGVKTNPFHPLHNEPSSVGAPSGFSKKREALRDGRQPGEALPIPGAGAGGRRKSVVIPGAGKVSSQTKASMAVLQPDGAVSRAAAAAVGGQQATGGTGSVVGKSLAAQTLALRRLADQGRSDLVPSSKRRESDEDSFDDDL
jgi:hypothetical protein